MKPPKIDRAVVNALTDDELKLHISSLGWFLDALGFTTLLNRTAPDAVSQ